MFRCEWGLILHLLVGSPASVDCFSWPAETRKKTDFPWSWCDFPKDLGRHPTVLFEWIGAYLCSIWLFIRYFSLLVCPVLCLWLRSCSYYVEKLFLQSSDLIFIWSMIYLLPHFLSVLWMFRCEWGFILHLLVGSPASVNCFSWPARTRKNGFSGVLMWLSEGPR